MLSNLTFTQTEGEESIAVSVGVTNNLASDSIEITSVTITPTDCDPITFENLGIVPAGSLTYANGTTTDADVMEVEDYAVTDVTYTEIIPYTVTFETVGVPNGEGAGSADQQIVNSGDYASRPSPDPTNEGYVLSNWYDSYTLADGYGNVFDFENTPIEADTTIYAKWEAEAPAPTPVTVSFQTITVPNGEGAGTPESQTVNTGGYATRPSPDPTNEGYVLTNWYDSYDDMDGYGNVFDFENTPIVADTTIYAKWEADAQPGE